jgi:hypothetical protein
VYAYVYNMLCVCVCVRVYICIYFTHTHRPYTARPIKVEGFNGPLTKNRVRDVACGPTFNIACCEGGCTYSWGSAWAGCLGMGDTKSTKIVATPTQMEALRGQKIVQLAGGQSHVLALTDSCNVWAWGSAEFGKLGLGDVSQLPSDSDGLIHAPLPMHVEDLHRKHVVQVLLYLLILLLIPYEYCYYYYIFLLLLLLTPQARGADCSGGDSLDGCDARRCSLLLG